MDRKDIVERVAKECFKEFGELTDEQRAGVNVILETSGLFDLLEIAEVYHRQENPSLGKFMAIGHCKKCACKIPSISDEYCSKCKWEMLDAAITKVKGKPKLDYYAELIQVVYSKKEPFTLDELMMVVEEKGIMLGREEVERMLDIYCVNHLVCKYGSRYVVYPSGITP